MSEELKYRAYAPSPAQRSRILDVFRAVVETDEKYLPEVTTGSVKLEDWFDAKPLNGGIVAWRGKDPIGFIGLRQKNDPLGLGLEWEVCRLAVLPEEQGRGVGTALVRIASSLLGQEVWCTCVKEGASHLLFKGLGWLDSGDVELYADPAPGVLLRSPLS